MRRQANTRWMLQVTAMLLLPPIPKGKQQVQHIKTPEYQAVSSALTKAFVQCWQGLEEGGAMCREVGGLVKNPSPQNKKRPTKTTTLLVEIATLSTRAANLRIKRAR